MPEVSQSTQKLIQRYQAWYQSQQIQQGVPTIHVDTVALTVAGFYEKIRGVVDWREEHLMRRAAIERNQKRRLLLTKNSKDTAEHLVLELVRGGHFPNDKIPENKTSLVQKAIDKYLYVLENAPQPTNDKTKPELYDWLLSIAACEIEEILSPPSREKAMIEFMMDSIKEKTRVREGIIVIGGMTEEEKNNQIYIAIQRALFKLDGPIIIYNLLKRKYSLWPELENSNPQLQEITRSIYQLWGNFERELRHPLAEKFYRLCERYDTAYLILGDVISEDPMNIPLKLKTPEELENKIISTYQKRLKTLKTRVGRAAFYATLSIFITKIILALAVEMRFDKNLSNHNYYALGLNILIPPLLMLFLITTIRPPKKENLQQVIIEVMKITYENERKDVYTIEVPKKRGWLMNAVITFFYLASFFVSFGLISWGLIKLNFGLVSIIVFLLFVSLISFAGTKLRERSKELEISEPKESFFMAFIDIFSLPLIRLGKWLSGQWARYNVIVIFFNFLIDMPFQVFVEFLEQWRSFLKEKKDEIH